MISNPMQRRCCVPIYAFPPFAQLSKRCSSTRQSIACRPIRVFRSSQHIVQRGNNHETCDGHETNWRRRSALRFPLHFIRSPTWSDVERNRSGKEARNRGSRLGTDLGNQDPPGDALASKERGQINPCYSLFRPEGAVAGSCENDPTTSHGKRGRQALPSTAGGSSWSPPAVRPELQGFETCVPANGGYASALRDAVRRSPAGRFGLITSFRCSTPLRSSEDRDDRR